MWKTIILQNKLKEPSDSGFITLEIIIALLIAFGFLMVSLQTITLGMVFKVGAQKEQRGDKLIQQEVEKLNDLGNLIALADAPLAIDSRQAACRGNFNGTVGDGYGQALWNLRKSLADINDTPVATNATVTADTAPLSRTETYLGRTLTITGTRNTTPGNNTLTPHRVLGISYQVTTDENGDGTPETIANRYVEVIPDAALECP